MSRDASPHDISITVTTTTANAPNSATSFPRVMADLLDKPAATASPRSSSHHRPSQLPICPASSQAPHHPPPPAPSNAPAPPAPSPSATAPPPSKTPQSQSAHP